MGDAGLGANDGPRAAAATARAEAIAAESAALTSYLEQNPTVLEGFARDLLPLMLEVRSVIGRWFACLSSGGRLAHPRLVAIATLCQHCLRYCTMRHGSQSSCVAYRAGVRFHSAAAGAHAGAADAVQDGALLHPGHSSVRTQPLFHSQQTLHTPALCPELSGCIDCKATA